MDIDKKLWKQPTKLLLFGQVLLRVMATGTALGAAYTMFTCNQTVSVLGFYLTATWTYSPALKYVAYANTAACGCCALSLILLITVIGSNRSRCFFAFFLHDLAVMGVMTGACAAGTTVGWIGKYGNEHAGWIPICDKFDKYCNRMTTSLVLTYASCSCLLLLVVLSAWQNR